MMHVRHLGNEHALCKNALPLLACRLIVMSGYSTNGVGNRASIDQPPLMQPLCETVHVRRDQVSQ